MWTAQLENAYKCLRMLSPDFTVILVPWQPHFYSSLYTFATFPLFTCGWAQTICQGIIVYMWTENFVYVNVNAYVWRGP